jgi:hypothetical protein
MQIVIHTNLGAEEDVDIELKDLESYLPQSFHHKSNSGALGCSHADQVERDSVRSIAEVSRKEEERRGWMDLSARSRPRSGAVADMGGATVGGGGAVAGRVQG